MPLPFFGERPASWWRAVALTASSSRSSGSLATAAHRKPRPKPARSFRLTSAQAIATRGPLYFWAAALFDRVFYPLALAQVVELFVFNYRTVKEHIIAISGLNKTESLVGR
jgi:hypothetical protein